MTTTINASPTNGLVQTADGSGVLKVQSNGVTTNALAWVNFNGTGTVAIRSSYNVSSITDNGTGDYRVNFTNALSDANYSAPMTASNTIYYHNTAEPLSQSTTSLSVYCSSRGTSSTGASGGSDMVTVQVAVFGN